jgi:predicted HTH domain antitoxin
MPYHMLSDVWEKSVPRITDGRTNVSLTIPDALLQSARISEAELRQEIAILLFQRDKLTLAQASRFAHLSRLQFQHLLTT